MRKHFFNEKYFKVIDCQDKAYWLGFIAADGCVTKASKYNSYRLQLNLQESDKHHLEKLRNSLNGDTIKIKNIKCDNRKQGFGISYLAGITFNSYELCKDLMELNITPSKSYTISIPNIKHELIRHYIRGFIDGDGSFTYVKSKNYNSYKKNVEIVGVSYLILEQIKNFLSESNIKANIYKRKSNNTYRLMICSNQSVYNLYYYLYTNANIFLERKREKAETMKNLAAQSRNALSYEWANSFTEGSLIRANDED